MNGVPIKKYTKHGFKHFTVNHKKNFVDPKTKKHSQLIECLWGVAISTIIKRSRGSFKDNLPGKLAEHWLRSIHIKTPVVIFEEILKLILTEDPKFIDSLLESKQAELEKDKNAFII